jgi:hypothetical protein
MSSAPRTSPLQNNSIHSTHRHRLSPHPIPPPSLLPLLYDQWCGSIHSTHRNLPHPSLLSRPFRMTSGVVLFILPTAISSPHPFSPAPFVWPVVWFYSFYPPPSPLPQPIHSYPFRMTSGVVPVKQGACCCSHQCLSSLMRTTSQLDQPCFLFSFCEVSGLS